MRVRLLAVALATAVCVMMVAGPASAQAANGQVTVIHGIPGVVVDVYVNDALQIEDFEFGTVTDPLSLPPATYQLEIFLADDDPATDSPVLTGSAAVAAGGNYTVIANLTASGDPDLNVFVNDVSQIPAGKARVYVRHTADAPAVDVLVNGAVAVSNLANPNQAGPLDVAAGTVSASVAPTGTTTPVIGPADLTLSAGTVYFVHAVGSPESKGGSTLQLLVQSVSGLGAPAAAAATPAPQKVAAGSGGLAGDGGLPVVTMAAMGLAIVMMVVSGARLALVRR